MTSVVQQRWRTRQLVGDKQHAMIVRVRPGYMDRGYMASKRIDDGSTPFNGSPIFPPLIWKGNNHNCWQGQWTPTGDWLTLPSVENSKWKRDFDVQTGAAKGTATLTTIMDNIAFPEEEGIGGLYHAIDRGHFSPMRGVTVPTRARLWPQDAGNEWQNVLNAGYQIELWEGYGTGNDIKLKDTLDPATNSYAPDSGALARTFTGIVVDCETESHPDKITITAQDFGTLLTDQRLVGTNKALECRSPVRFADRRRTQGEAKLTGPYKVSSGNTNEDGMWNSGTNSLSTAVEHIEIVLPKGYYEDFFVSPLYDGMEMFVSVFVGSGGGTMDRTTALPGSAWVDLTGPGTGDVPGGGPRYIRDITTLAQSPSRRWALGHGFDLPNGSKLRLSFTNLSPLGLNPHYFAGVNEFAAYRFGSNPLHPAGGGGGVNAKGWVLVEDAAEVVRMLLIWAGFKEWYVEDFGWTLYHPMVFGEDKFLMDVISDMLQQGSFIFYMGAPTNDDRSIGVPHFEHIHALDPPSHTSTLEVRDTDMLEALQVKWDLSDLPWVMRYRGAISKRGQSFGQDLTKRYMATYYPPWSGRHAPLASGEFASAVQIRRIAGIRRHFTETMSLTLAVALTSRDECLFACVLAAIQYYLNMVTGTFQIPGLPGLDLNRQISVAEEASAVNARMWLTSVESDHEMGPNGKWSMTVGGTMLDTPDWLSIVDDYNYAWKLNQRHKAAF